MHTACLLLGSNIRPWVNLQRAVILLRRNCEVKAISSVWETQAVGSSGPNFLNAAVLITTHLEIQEFRLQVIACIETTLGRVRTQDKYADRTIDIDILIFDDILRDSNLWVHGFMALPTAELLPSLINPETGKTLSETAASIRQQIIAFRHPDIHL